MHGMCDVMITRGSSGEEAALADIIVETFQTSEAQTNDGIFLADLAFRFMFHALGARQTMEGWDPDDALRFLAQPVQELLRRY